MLYLTQRSPEFLPLMRSAIRRLEQMGIGEAFNDEAAPGQFELNLAPTDPVTAADWTVRAKRALRDAAYEHRACGHVHGPAVPGLRQRLAPAPVAVARRRTRVRRRRRSVALLGRRNAGHGGGGDVDLCPDDQFVPPPGRLRRRADHPTWGEDNKGAVRTITRPAASVPSEHRLAAADANPYLVLAAILAGGLAGLEERIDPPEPVTNLPWGLPDRSRGCPARSPPPPTLLPPTNGCARAR